MKQIITLIATMSLLLGCMQTGTKTVDSTNDITKQPTANSTTSDYFIIVAATYKKLGADDVEADELRQFKFATKGDCDLFLVQNMQSIVSDYKDALKRKQEGRKLIRLFCGKKPVFQAVKKKYIVFAFLKKGIKVEILEYKSSTFDTREECLNYSNTEQALIKNSLNNYIKEQMSDYKLSFIGCESRELIINLTNNAKLSESSVDT